MTRLDLLDQTRPFLLTRLPATRVEALYVHIPFCFHKCHYCDFYSITRQTDERMDAFVDLLLAEASLWRDSPVTITPRTIFFGGGTPSLLPASAMQRLLRGLAREFDLSHVDEWTVEVNPATADLEYLSMMRGLGVTRISMGAQSFVEKELEMLERRHAPSDVVESVKLARRAGFDRINCDLIFAIPGQTSQSWRYSIERTLDLGIDHLSAYALTYEPNTPLAVRKRLGRLEAIDEDIELSMLGWTRSRLEQAGFEAYEISNFARPAQACRHNLAYWRGRSYVALGPSGASHVEGHRWKNRPHLREWEQSIEAGLVPACEYESLTPLQRAGERMMLGLRLGEGVSIAQFSDETTIDPRVAYRAQIERLLQLQLIRIDDRIRLTDRGIPVADAIAAEFLDVG